MKRLSPLLLSVLLGASLLSGCVTTKTTRLDAPEVTVADGAFTAWAPAGWVATTLTEAVSSAAVVSRDGPPIHYILLQRHDHQKAFSGLERDSTPDMLPTELAETLLAEMRKDDETEHLEVVENSPATIAGRAGVLLHIRFRNDKGLEIQRRVYAFVDSGGIYTLSYQAPTLHYFDRDFEVFEHTVRSFRTGA